MENNSQIQIKFKWIYSAGIFLILALPLLSLAPLFHPPDFAKSIVFRIIFSVLIFIFIFQILYKKQDNTFLTAVRNVLSKKNDIFLPFWLLVSYLFVLFLATIFSLEPGSSLWDSPYRGGGFLTLSFTILFAVFVFLVLKPKDWKKIWNYIFIIGVLMSLIAIFQKFRLFGKIFVAYAWQPIATMGGPMFLALYLILLVFLPLSFAIISKGKKRFLYPLFSLLFIFIIIITAVRSAFLGLGFGFLFFIFFYPNQNKSKIIKRIKILSALLLIIISLGAFWLKNQSGFAKNLKEESLFGPAFIRVFSLIEDFSIEKILRSRGSGWKVGFRGLMDRPILGYGPENFSIAFDRYYDPNLPGIAKEPGSSGTTGWWDRGHNFMLDISVGAGIPALLIYLLLFGILFFKLQKIKNKKPEITEPQAQKKAIISHAIQATFIGYLATNFFNFDVFPTYLVLFLLIGYSFSLISQNNISLEKNKNNKNYSQKTVWKPVFLAVLFFITVWFIWSANLKPLFINKKINIAIFLSENRQPEEALKIIESAYNKGHSIIDSYLRLRYIDIISSGYSEFSQKKELNYKTIKLAEEVVKKRPYYTRAWMIDGIYTTYILESDENLNQNDREKLIERAYSSFEKSHQLNPKHQRLYIGWIRLDLLLKRYEDAKKRVQECININSDFRDCWWAKALVYGNLGDLDTATEAILISKEKGFDIEERALVAKLINLYGKIVKLTNDLKHYEILAELYQRINEIEPKNFQNHASLAYIYAKLGKYDKARKEAEIVLELSPESHQKVEEFLKTLPY